MHFVIEIPGCTVSGGLRNVPVLHRCMRVWICMFCTITCKLGYSLYDVVACRFSVTLCICWHGISKCTISYEFELSSVALLHVFGCIYENKYANDFRDYTKNAHAFLKSRCTVACEFEIAYVAPLHVFWLYMRKQIHMLF